MLAQILLSLALLAPPAVLEGPGVCQAALKRVALNKAKPETMLERTFVCAMTVLGALRHGVAPEEAVATVYIESKMMCGEVSTAGCIGPAQISPRWHCDCPECDPKHCANCLAQLNRGIEYFAELRARYPLITSWCIYSTGNFRSCISDPIAFGGPKLYALKAFALRNRFDL
ncbi:MAG: hypothetical protein GY871_04405 [Actinomycetales bacterium]|nr:hypothetical protein [Actinomycetales bacterium]